jgi:hypothetical protein
LGSFSAMPNSPSLHLGPDLAGLDAGLDPKRHQIVDQIGAFLDHRLGVALDGVDHHLDRLLGQLLGHLAAAGAQQLRGPRRRRIGGLGRHHGPIEAVDRIGHARQHSRNLVKIALAPAGSLEAADG